MQEFTNFLSTNAALTVSILALVVSLASSRYARNAYQLNLRNKTDSDRVLLFDRKREILNEVDKQHCLLATLSALIAQKLLLLERNPQLSDHVGKELKRLSTNLDAIVNITTNTNALRQSFEEVDAGTDLTRLAERLADVRRVNIHLEKDIALEKSDLELLRSKLKDSGGVNRAHATSEQKTDGPATYLLNTKAATPEPHDERAMRSPEKDATLLEKRARDAKPSDMKTILGRAAKVPPSETDQT